MLPNNLRYGDVSVRIHDARGRHVLQALSRTRQALQRIGPKMLGKYLYIMYICIISTIIL